MRRIVMLLGICLVSVYASGCAGFAYAPVIPPQGIIYTKIEAPISTNFDGATPVAQKSGKATAMSILGLVALGDASVDAAAREGNLSTIHYADYTLLHVFGVYTEFTTVVYGE